MYKKVKMALARNVTMANHLDLLCRNYGDVTRFRIEEPLPYGVLPPGKVQFTLNEWKALVDRVGNVLTDRLGVKKGDRVAVVPTNGLDVLTITVAIMRVGAIAVPINYLLKGKEIKYIVEDSGAKVLFTDPEIFRNNIGDRSLLPTVERWVLGGMPGEAPEGFESLDVLIGQVPGEFTPASITRDDVVGIFYTSGTTGFPKGAMLTSKGLLGAQSKAAVVLPLSPKDFAILALPLSHIFGFAVTILGSNAGVGGIIMKYFDPRKVLKLIEEYKATSFVGVPAMYAFLLASEPEKYDISSLKLIASAADAMPPEHIERMQELASRPGLIRKRKPLVAEVYGMVELTGAVALKPALPGLKWPPGCVGFPVPPIRAKIVDDNGRKVKRGRPGELLIKGPNVTPGYWNNPEATRNVIVDGWFHTGDMAKMDRLGRIFFVDRVKDVIKCGGYSIFSVEVEEEILQNKEIEEVAVIGIPHRTMGHVPMAVVCLREGSILTEEEVSRWCAENIAEYKAPRIVRIIPIEEMPFGVTLKIMKKDLRDRFVEELGLLG